MLLTIIRHGQTKINFERKIQGSKTNEKLNATGRKQIKDLAYKLLKTNASFDIIAASPLSRALESANILNTILKIDSQILIEPLFQERDFGYFEKFDIDEFYKLKDTRDIDEFYESDEELIARINYAVHDLAARHKDQKVLMVAHSQVIKSLLILAQAKDYHFKSAIDNGELYSFRIEDRKIVYIK